MYEAIENATINLEAARQILVDKLDMSVSEASILLFELMLNQSDEAFADLAATDLTEIKTSLEKAAFSDLKLDEKRQVLQLLLVGMQRQDQLQANYQITPDAIGMWFSYLVSHITKNETAPQIMDLTAGAGNLLATIAENEPKGVYSALENDDTMISLASGLATLLGQTWQLEHDDAVAAEINTRFDVVMADLPVGYYPKAVSNDFVTANQSGKLSYVQHLLIEKAVKILKPAGTALLLVPANLFDTEAAKGLLKFLQTENVYLQAFLRFPGKMFASQANAKALLVLQTAGEGVKQASPVLLAAIPSYTDQQATERFLAELDAWLIENHL
ncbi:adenine-specific DNA methyltransferase [Weissella oryzae SG25]|uniref:Adenine-specific DNA methyltransferase n=1 Tax=Weissella oryzae (strain DSM 25784 / JCM 18191 / LMG 30913 / SG25) TaxID=1329250 RepID=A0A069CZY5_WEIOS|nr:class I SAM-dependent methyltransferase [Weissella oryzae]GAK30656.1 adenine-specific DNA methyltransferase [Weissella oryzae SG25]